ncbi:Holliday junction resolvase RecU [Metabacillus sediminilitoris]|uniref:Holliday junction resolvase RecU n=1 Tax=Metabacillus sediminilitoris TaxID=2567941 RepID=A0A4S4C5D5_9BACI|nr:Holliday junction resolvase RecU [Metabacillus sediminilitoris]THF82804.1 Holliday junction resolvase RecU [Metabacillus sediminilitoris]
MIFHYPNGKPYQPKAQVEQKKQKTLTYSNRGMILEDDLNETNKYYLENNLAVIHKKPTPVQIVNVDYPRRSAAVIKEAYFKQSSTTDYNGIYRGKYIDFEAKETKNKTSFPLQNFHEHQIVHMENVLHQGGICFVILSAFNEIYFLEAQHLLTFWKRQEAGGRKSFTYNELIEIGYKIPLGYQARIDYLKIIDKLYF